MTAARLFFIAAPILLATILLWRFPRCRRVKLRHTSIYIGLMTVLIWIALQCVAYVAHAAVPVQEIVVVLWFALGWRLGWALWSRTVGVMGNKWVRWARLQRRCRRSVSCVYSLIPWGRAALAAFVFWPVFVATVLVHRCKLVDGQDPQTVFQLPFESVRFATADGLVLDGWFVPEANSERTIIICHGLGANKGNFVWYLKPLSGHGYNLLMFDFRAHGRSDGRRTTMGIAESRDVRAAVDWLKKEHPKESRKVVGLGSSLGAAAVALAAAEDPRIGAIVLDSAFVSHEELAMYHAEWVPVVGPLYAGEVLFLMSALTGTNFFSHSVEDAMGRVGSRPVLIIHGSEDMGIPRSHARRLYNAASGPREIWYASGPHSNIITTAPGKYARRVIGFLDAQWGPLDAEAVPRQDAQDEG